MAKSVVEEEKKEDQSWILGVVVFAVVVGWFIGNVLMPSVVSSKDSSTQITCGAQHLTGIEVNNTGYTGWRIGGSGITNYLEGKELVETYTMTCERRTGILIDKK